MQNGKSSGPGSPPSLVRQQEAADRWGHALPALRKPKDEHAFETYLKPIVPLGFTAENVLVLLSQTKTSAQRVKKSYGQAIEQKLGCKVEIYDVDSYEPAQEKQPANGTRGTPVADIRSFDTIQQRPVGWLWRHRFPLGKFSELVGDPGRAKSLLSIDIAARISRGSDFPDGQKAPRGNVIIISAEDDPEDTIKPRLQAAGADLRAIHFLSGVHRPTKDAGTSFSPFSLQHDIGSLGEEIRRRHVILVICDPISAFLGSADARSNSEIRALLHPLVETLAATRAAMIGLTHRRKAEGSAVFRPIDSLAFVAIARAAYGVSLDGENHERHVFFPIKCNLSKPMPGLAYGIAVEKDIPRIVWESEPVVIDTEQIFGSDPRGEDRPALHEATRWLREQLSGGPKRARDLMTASQATGLRWHTVRNAAEALKVEKGHARKTDPWMWWLPSAKSSDAIAR
jgi:hypothetical protein